MKTQTFFALAASVFAVASASARQPNTLSDSEKKDGWKLLFDGKSFNNWRVYRKEGPPDKGWAIKDGALTCVKGGKGGNLITHDQFTDYEFSWEWKIPPRSNNGVKYMVEEKHGGPIGHEYQLIDDALVKNHAESSCASFYLVVAPDENKKVMPFGEWNHSKISVKGNHVEHWLNGGKVLEYELGDPEILAQVKKTKFKNVEGFGTKKTAHIVLTYHNDECAFRNIKIRELK